MSGWLAAWVDANPGYAMVAALMLPATVLIECFLLGAAARWLWRRPVALTVLATLVAIFVPLAAVNAAG
jgi:hypothetical protein